MVIVEGTINVLEEGVQKFWNFHSEQLELEKPSFEEHLLLLQLNSSCHLLWIWKLFTVQFEVIVVATIWT